MKRQETLENGLLFLTPPFLPTHLASQKLTADTYLTIVASKKKKEETDSKREKVMNNSQPKT